MNKKYVIGGIVICVGIAGWIGMHVLENRTEKAVAEALSTVPAQAREISYSLLNNTLLLKGVTYDVSDEDISRKGSVDQVEIKGFNPACLSDTVSVYNPDTLPVVAESMTASGISDDIRFGDMHMVQKVDEIGISGWYQRLGVLMEQFRRHREAEAFYEELYRCRLDGMDLRNIHYEITFQNMRSPVTFDMEHLGLSEGVRAPRGDEKVTPISVYLSGIRFAGKEENTTLSGTLQRVDIKDVMMPDPAVVAEVLAISRELNADGEDSLETFDQQFTAMMTLLQNDYDKKLLFSQFAMKDFQLSIDEKTPSAVEPFMTVLMKSLEYRLGLTNAGEHTYAAVLDSLQLKMAELSRNAIIKRYAPDGFTINAGSESLISDTNITGQGRYELVGLGELEGDMALSGNIKMLRNVAMLDLSVEPYELLQAIQLQKLHVNYRDSGLMAMTMELLAADGHQAPEDMLNVLLQNVQVLSQFPDQNARQLGAMLTEQLTRPGECGMSYEPERPVSVMELVSLLMVNPGAVPVTFSSKPGDKLLMDYLPKPQPAADGE